MGNDNDADKTRYEPHYNEITRPDQVQIYEDILGAPEGRVTTGILTGIRYLKDNRLIPAGFDKRTADRETAGVGAALHDPDFGWQRHRALLGRHRLLCGTIHRRVGALVSADRLPLGPQSGTLLCVRGPALLAYYNAMGASTGARIAAATLETAAIDPGRQGRGSPVNGTSLVSGLSGSEGRQER